MMLNASCFVGDAVGGLLDDHDGLIFGNGLIILQSLRARRVILMTYAAQRNFLLMKNMKMSNELKGLPTRHRPGKKVMEPCVPEKEEMVIPCG